jgi:ribonuclease P protein component
MNSPSQPSQRQSLAGARLRKRADFLRAYAAGRKRQSTNMSWFLAPQTAEGAGAHPRRTARVGLTVGKVLGKSHQRNRIKRRMREALRHHIGLLPDGFDLVFHPRRNVMLMEFVQLESEIVRILEQARVEAARAGKTPASVPRAPVTHAS